MKPDHMPPEERSDRLIEAASAILNVVPNQRLNIVVLNKSLFYLDLVSLRDHARPVTYNSYIAIQQGPVVAKYPQRLVGQLESRRIGKQISEWDGSKPIQLEQFPEHFRYLDADALALAAAVASNFALLSSRQASDYSHDNPGWRLAWNDYRRSGKPAAIDMRVAMQQVIEDDPWMEIPPSDDEVLADADAGIGDEW
jgi:hypothetical protein